MELRADMFSCRNDSAVRIDVNLTDPLQHLFSKIPSLNEMPHISTLTQAREQVIEKVQLELANVRDYHRKSFDRLDEITEPIIGNMKKTLRNRFTDSSTWKITIAIGVPSFFFSCATITIWLFDKQIRTSVQYAKNFRRRNYHSTETRSGYQRCRV